MLSGVLGGLQNYLCYSNSLLYFKVSYSAIHYAPGAIHHTSEPPDSDSDSDTVCCVLQCGGGGPLSGYLLTAATAFFMAIGPSVIYYMPRVMPGCLLMHIGVDLTIEGSEHAAYPFIHCTQIERLSSALLSSPLLSAVAALWDSRGSLDSFEYGSVVAISVVMTLFGMTEGLALGVLCAALTFTLQAGRHVPPIRGSMTARTLRSSR